MTELPSGWADCRLSDICEINPALDRCPFPPDGDVHFVPMPAVEAESGRIDVSRLRPYNDVRKGYTAFVAGDVLFAKITPCMENGKMAVVPQLPASVALGSTEFHVLRCRDGIAPQYVYYFVSSLAFRREAEHHMTGAVGQKRVPTSFLSDHAFPLPPTREQTRIVAKIEELFSKLDKAVESLTLARAQLKTYRQALLKAAFEGRLTTDWRAANPDKLEPPETLLDRIRLEREARHARALAEWKKALAKWRAGGEEGRKPEKPSPFKEITQQALSLRQNGWIELALDYLIGDMQQGWSPSCDSHARISCEDWSIVKTTAVQHALYDDTEIKRLPDHLLPRPEIEIQIGDFLMTRKGPRIRTGVVCLVRRTRNRIMLCDTVYRFRCDDFLLFPPFLELALNSPETLREIDSLKAGISESGISLNHGKVRSISVAFPTSYQEQVEIVKRVDIQLSQGAAIDVEIVRALAQIDALRQSILKQAFAGRLVPQNPADEPAAALLARLREAAAPPARARRRKTA